MAHLKISPDFFKMEVREGFPVGELMKRNWAAQLQVLEDVRELCDKILWLNKGLQIAFGDDVKEICDRYQAFLDGKLTL